MKKEVFKPIIQMMSVATSIIAVLVAYYVGEELWRSWQACLLGIALWLVSLSIFSLLKMYDEEITKRDILTKNITFVIILVSLACILPFGVLLPVFGDFKWVGDIRVNRMTASWEAYSLIFSAVFIVAYIISLIYKKRKH